MPMMVDAPGLLRMTIGCPSCFSAARASTRAVWSVLPPGAHGTIMVIGRSGKRECRRGGERGQSDDSRGHGLDEPFRRGDHVRLSLSLQVRQRASHRRRRPAPARPAPDRGPAAPSGIGADALHRRRILQASGGEQAGHRLACTNRALTPQQVDRAERGRRRTAPRTTPPCARARGARQSSTSSGTRMTAPRVSRNDLQRLERALGRTDRDGDGVVAARNRRRVVAALALGLRQRAVDFGRHQPRHAIDPVQAQRARQSRAPCRPARRRSRPAARSSPAPANRAARRPRRRATCSPRCHTGLLPTTGPKNGEVGNQPNRRTPASSSVQRCALSSTATTMAP